MRTVWFLGTALALAINVVAAPKLVLEERSFDFGNIDNLSSVSHEVFFRNDGDEPLTVKVKASCGCTAGKLEKDNLAAGERSHVTVTFNPKGRSGKNVKSLMFTTNDPANPTQTVRFTANIEPLWQVTPRQVEFNYSLTDGKFDAESREFTVENSGKKPLTVVKVDCFSHCFTITGPEGKVLQPGERAQYKATFVPDYVPERLTRNSASFKLAYGGETHAQTVVIAADVVPLWKVTPRQVVFTYDLDEKTLSPDQRDLTITNTSKDKSFTIVSVKSNQADRFAVKGPETTEVAPGQKVTYDVTPTDELDRSRPAFGWATISLREGKRDYSKIVSISVRPQHSAKRAVIQVPPGVPGATKTEAGQKAATQHGAATGG